MGLQFMFAPTSQMVTGPSKVGKTTAMPGRLTPGRFLILIWNAATQAPVFPAEITASAWCSLAILAMTPIELLRFLEDGNLEASNNLAEQAIRPIAIGRKNYLFSTSMKGATANAMAYTIIETAKANNLNPSKYLNYLFEKLPNTDFIRNPDVLVDFLPWAKTVQEICQ